MGRTKLYANDAERQRVCRARAKLRSQGVPETPTPQLKKRRAPSRPSQLQALIAELQRLQAEYEDWLDVLPSSLEESELATRLTETIEQFEAAIDILAGMELPKGYGRD